jgi:hypothetical protein
MLSQEKTIIEIRDERQLKAIAGVTESQLEKIAAEFEQVEKEARAAKYEQAVLNGKRVRKPGGGHKGILRTPIQKVLFVLVYCKIYPTYDDLGSRFGLSKSAAFDNIAMYFPLVQKALGRLGVLPHRTFNGVEEFREIFSAWFKNGDKRVTCWSPQNSVGMPKHEGLDSNLNTLSVTLN